jgi:tetratricopeptide (TPR) repeat protein
MPARHGDGTGVGRAGTQPWPGPEAYGPRRLPQRVPQPVPPRRTGLPYLAVTIDPTSPDAATAARRHRRDQLFAGGEGAPTDEEVIMDAAGQSAEFGEWAEGTNVGETTLEQFDDDVRRISRDYLNNPPLPLMLDAIRVRNRVFTLLEGRQHPEQTRHLYLTAGRLCGLLAWMASDVGRHVEADTQARTAWLCAELAGADGLRAWVRAIQSKVAYWDGRLRESAQLARDGLRFGAPDTAHVLLASLGARAWARLGDADEAHAALHTAEEERERAGADEVGGLLGFSEAQQSYMAGSAHLWLKEPDQALAAADRAVWLFGVGGQSVRFYGAEMLALVDAAAALTQAGELDGAAERLRPVLELPPEQQLDTFTSRLGELRDGLRRSRYAMSKPAVDMQRQIEEFRSGALGQILGR